MTVSVDALKGDVAIAAKAALTDLQTKGIPVAVTATLRTEADQVALYHQGRCTLDLVNLSRHVAGLAPIASVENTYTVTNCDGVNTPSNHQGGRALDVVPTENGKPVWPVPLDQRWLEVSNVMKAHGFKWGGDWAGGFKDYPHYEM